MASFFDYLGQAAGQLVDKGSTAANLPALGISEFLNGGRPTQNTGRINEAYASAAPYTGGGSPVAPVVSNPGYSAATGGSNGNAGGYAGNVAAVAGGGVSAADLAYLDDQAAQLRSLLARTDTGLNQGLTQNEDEYQRQLGQSQADKARQLAAYEDQRVQQNQGKLNTYDTINKNANNGYRSLAQIIGRAAGTGSSAFRELLPNVIGSDTSSKRNEANQTYGANLQGIDKAQNQYDISFADVLDDLLRQKKTNESTLRSGIENQRQTLNSQLGTVEGQKAQARGGGYAQVKAAQAPAQQAIENSRNQVESFFNQFRTAYTPKQAVAATPELAGYTADRSVINAQNQGAIDATNPYAALLKKRQAGAL